MTDRPTERLPHNVLVTGASSGIGRVIAVRLARAGVGVAVNYHGGRERAADLVREIEGDGGRAVVIGGDMSDESDVERAFAEARDALGPLDGCVLNAGMQRDASLARMTLEEWRAPLTLDLDGAFLGARVFLRQLPERADGTDPETSGVVPGERPRARGAIVFVTSVHAFVPWAGHANYAAAKAGADMLMRTMAQEVAHEGVRANAVAPGAIRTPINRDVWDDPKRLEKLMELIPYGRLGEGDDVAEAVAWLLSDASDYVTGTTLTVDGGMSLYPGFIGNG